MIYMINYKTKNLRCCLIKRKNLQFKFAWFALINNILKYGMLKAGFHDIFWTKFIKLNGLNNFET